MGDFVTFPRNQIIVADNEYRQYFKEINLKHLVIQRKLKQISAKQAVFECCFEQQSEVMVSKYLKCRMIDCSYSEEPRYVRALKNLGHALVREQGSLSDVYHFLGKKTIHSENVKEVGQQICLLLEDCESEANEEEVLALKQAISFLEEEYCKECEA